MAWMPTMSADMQAVLATDKVRFQGQEVAFVIADDRYSARDALELIDVEYEPLPSRRRRAPRARPGRAGDPRRRRPAAIDNHVFDWEAGDAAATDGASSRAPTSSSSRTCSSRARTRRRWRPAARSPTTTRSTASSRVWCTTQAPHAHRTLYALITGLPEHKIRVISPDVGGGFGNKVPVYPGYVCAIVGAIADRPAGEVDGGPLGEPDVDRVRARLRDAGPDRRHRARASMLGARASTCSPTTARSTPTAQPTRYPAGFFSVFTGSYDLEAAHCRVTGVYTNKAPGGVAYACSFRIAEAVYLVERMVDCLARELGHRPGRAAAANLLRARAVPVREQDRLGLRLGRLRARAAQGAGRSPATTSCAREQARAARARRADGHRRLVLHRGGRRRPAQAHGHHGAGDERRRRAARLTRPARRSSRSACRPRARATRRRSRRSSPRSSASRRRTSTSSTATPTRRRTASARTGRARRR